MKQWTLAERTPTAARRFRPSLNLLLDNDTIRSRIAAHVGAKGTDACNLLSAIGHDCVGALQFLRGDIDPSPAGAVDGETVSNKEITDILANLAINPLGFSEE